MAEFGIDPSSLVGFMSDGAAVMVAAGKELGIIHQTCLGICCTTITVLVKDTKVTRKNSS